MGFASFAQLALVFCLSGFYTEAGAAQTCQEEQMSAMVRLASCRTTASAKAVKKGREPNYERCDKQFQSAMRAVSQSDSTCISGVGNINDVMGTVAAAGDQLLAALSAHVVDGKAICRSSRIKAAASFYRCMGRKDPNGSRCLGRFISKYEVAGKKSNCSVSDPGATTMALSLLHDLRSFESALTDLDCNCDGIVDEADTQCEIMKANGFAVSTRCDALPGDCDGNGAVSGEDATCIQDCVFGVHSSGSDCQVAADCDCNGDVNLSDALCRQYACG